MTNDIWGPPRGRGPPGMMTSPGQRIRAGEVLKPIGGSPSRRSETARDHRITQRQIEQRAREPEADTTSDTIAKRGDKPTENIVHEASNVFERAVQTTQNCYKKLV